MVEEGCERGWGGRSSEGRALVCWVIRLVLVSAVSGPCQFLRRGCGGMFTLRMIVRPVVPLLSPREE